MFHDDKKNEHLRLFRHQVEAAIAKHAIEGDERKAVERQKQQIERLVALETEFRRTLIRHQWGQASYSAFVRFITEEKRNILAARPYFRERQDVFTREISVELKKGNEKGLYKFNFNYLFVQFVLRSHPWPAKSKIARLAKDIAALRTELAEINMPLAISRSRIFYRRTPESHLEYMDMVQIAAEGLMVAIDKFCLPYGARFRHMTIGRMVGFLIEQYSETMVHFFPTDKRKIYRANKVIHLLEAAVGGGVDFDKLAAEVNKGARENHQTNPSEIADLVSAASCVSADVQVSTGSEEQAAESFLDRFSSAEDEQPDRLAEESEALSVMRSAMKQLGVLEVKFLRLKGVEG